MDDLRRLGTRLLQGVDVHFLYGIPALKKLRSGSYGRREAKTGSRLNQGAWPWELGGGANPCTDEGGLGPSTLIPAALS